MTNLCYPSSLSVDGLESEIRRCEDAIECNKREAAERFEQALMAEAMDDRAEGLRYRAVVQTCRDAAMLLRLRKTDCQQELKFRAAKREYSVTVLCDGGDEVVCLGTAGSKSEAETNAWWSCQEQMLRPVSADAELVN
jgi:hypothetical protein